MIIQTMTVMITAVVLTVVLGYAGHPHKRQDVLVSPLFVFNALPSGRLSPGGVRTWPKGLQ